MPENSAQNNTKLDKTWNGLKDFLKNFNNLPKTASFNNFTPSKYRLLKGILFKNMKICRVNK